MSAGAHEIRARVDLTIAAPSRLHAGRRRAAIAGVRLPASIAVPSPTCETYSPGRTTSQRIAVARAPHQGEFGERPSRGEHATRVALGKAITGFHDR